VNTTYRRRRSRPRVCRCRELFVRADVAGENRCATACDRRQLEALASRLEPTLPPGKAKAMRDDMFIAYLPSRIGAINFLEASGSWRWSSRGGHYGSRRTSCRSALRTRRRARLARSGSILVGRGRATAADWVGSGCDRLRCRTCGRDSPRCLSSTMRRAGSRVLGVATILARRDGGNARTYRRGGRRTSTR